MKRLAYIILAVSALALGVTACDSQKGQVPAANTDGVELRYRANDIYELTAKNAEPIVIVVKSTKPWTVRSYNPDWCMIDHESGEAVADSLVHVGKGENTTVRIQYYDNVDLDDRTDYIEIASDGWVGKKVTVNQKGSAYISVPDEEQKIFIPKAASEAVFHVSSNQPWSAAITKIDGDWLSITEGSTGEGDGEVKVTALDNPAEMRYATVTLYDRHDKVVTEIKYTQDGVQLEPEFDEIRAQWNAAEASLAVAANTKWTVVKKDESDDWFTIQTASFTGDGVIKLTMQQNDATYIRSSSIIIATEPDAGTGFQVKREILVRQAYASTPVKYMMDPTEVSEWKSDKGLDPVYQEGAGMYFEKGTGDAYARLNRSMPAGSYAFHWKNFSADVEVRHWFCYSGGQEIKLYFYGSSIDLSFSVSAPEEKPVKTSGVTSGFDPAQDHTISVDYAQDGEYCAITVSVDGVMAYKFNTGPNSVSNCKWGANINMYLGVDKGSAVMDWYEYTPPFSWD